MGKESNPFNEELNEQFDKALKELDERNKRIEQEESWRAKEKSESEFWREQHPDSELGLETVQFSDYDEEDIGGTPPASPDRSRRKPKKKKKKKKWIIVVICIILVLLIAAFFVLNKLNMLGEDSNRWIKDNDISASDIDSIMDADSLNAWLKAWATNGGDKMKSRYVKSILLIGVDSKSKLSDSMILLSINERTHQIHLVSFYRDSYSYIQRNDISRGYFGKLNAAYGTGGAKCVVSTIENDYKIRINDYALVNYDTFPKIIDSLGGINVKVTQKEASYLNRTWHKWSMTGKKIQFHAGNMHMDGEHALMFCRIRKLDSDVGRTERQRRVILALMNRFKNASWSQLNHTINILLPNIKTNLSKREIMGYVSQSMTKGWSKYKVSQITMPTESTCVEGRAGNQWIWIVDYETAAHELQLQLYGQSNIILKPDRVSPLSFGKQSGGVNGNADRLPGQYNTTQYGDSSYVVYDTTSPNSEYYTHSYSGGSYEPTTAEAVDTGGELYVPEE